MKSNPVKGTATPQNTVNPVAGNNLLSIVPVEGKGLCLGV